MHATAGCPALSDYQRLVRGELPPAEIERLSGHLEGCDRCAAAVHTLLDADTVLDAVRQARGDTPTPKGELPAGLFQRLCTLKPPTSHTGTTTDAVTSPGEPAGQVAYPFLAPAQKSDEIGRLGPYRVLRVLGTGGMGVVFEAEDSQLRRKVALKVMKPAVAERPSARQRFLREARAAAAIEHDHIVPIYQVGEDRGVPFLAMQLLAGTSLDALLRKAGQLKPAQVERIGRQIAEGLAAAHERGLVHRDIKPGNVWIESAHGGRVKILDFGLARPQSPDPQSPYREGGDESRDEPALTESGAVVGTPSYMAPEQARGEKIDSRADLFSLGCVLYELATGKRPFTGADLLALLTSLALDTPRPPSDFGVPAGLSDLIVQLLAKNPADRPSSARAVADRLQAIERQPATPAVAQPSSTEEMPAAHPHAPPAPHRRGAGRKGWKRRALLAAAVVLAAFVPLGYFFGGTVVRLATNQGQIVIETDDPNIEVLIKDQAGTIIDRGSKREYTVKAGTEHEVEVTAKDERGEVQKFATRKFTVSRGRKEFLRVELEVAKAAKPETKKPEALKPGEPAAVAARDDRQAAEWVLSIGGRVGLVVEDVYQQIGAAKDLPPQTCRLIVADLGGNQQVSDAGLEHLKGLTNLRCLVLSGTQVSNAGLEHLKGLTNLVELGLDGRPVRDVGLEHLKGLTNLRILALSGTQVGNDGLVHLKGLTNLTSLTLNYTRVSNDGLVHLKSLTNLQSLNLAYTRVSDAGLEHLKGLTNLTELLLGNTQVGDAGLEPLKVHKKLRRLVLDGCPIRGTGLAHLKETHLTELRLGCPTLTDLFAKNVGELTKLERLSLAGSSITDDGLKPLYGLTNLKELDLTGLKVTAAGVAALQKALPQCKVLSGPAQKEAPGPR